MKKILRSCNLKCVYIAILLLFIVFSSKICAKDSFALDQYTSSVWGKLGYGLNLHSSNFQNLPSLEDCCNLYESAFGTGLEFALGYEYSFYNSLSQTKTWQIQISIGHNNYSGQFLVDEFKPVIIDNRLLDAKIEHSIDAKFNNLFVDLGANFLIFNDKFSIGSGLLLNYFYKAYISKKEELFPPNGKGGYLEEGASIRNVYEGDLNNSNQIIPAIYAEIAYSIEFGQHNKFKLVPILRYEFLLSNFVENVDWSMTRYSAAIRLAYNFNKIDFYSTPIEP